MIAPEKTSFGKNTGHVDVSEHIEQSFLRCRENIIRQFVNLHFHDTSVPVDAFDSSKPIFFQFVETQPTGEAAFQIPARIEAEHVNFLHLSFHPLCDPMSRHAVLLR